MLASTILSTILPHYKSMLRLASNQKRNNLLRELAVPTLHSIRLSRVLEYQRDRLQQQKLFYYGRDRTNVSVSR